MDYREAEAEIQKKAQIFYEMREYALNRLVGTHALPLTE